MGLDMYLNRRIYVGRHRYNKDVKPPAMAVEGVDVNKVKYIIEESAYWRKANAIHKWFVDNIQGGKDDCGEYYVSREQLKELFDVVVGVLSAHTEDVALEKLPPQGGFFFGSTAIDEYYWEDLEDTKKQLTEIMSIPVEKDDGDYYYQSSW